MECRSAPPRENGRGSHLPRWESRLYSERFEALADELLDELRPVDRAACVSAWAAQSESGQRLTRADLRELCAEHRADPDVVLPVFGYVRFAVTDSLGIVTGPGSPIDLLEVQRPRYAIYFDPLMRGAISALFLLREAYDLPEDKIALQGAKIADTTH